MNSMCTDVIEPYRDLAHEKGYPWSEYWDFLDSFVDLSSTEGLRKLEDYLSKRDFSPLTHEETRENETSNRFRTPSPGTFSSSILVKLSPDKKKRILILKDGLTHLFIHD